MFSKSNRETPAARERSVYQRVLGDEFAALDPQLRTYFGPISRGLEGIGAGRYNVAGLRIRILRPLFAVLGRWQIAFPEHGTDVAFTVRNVAAPDGTLRAERTFRFENHTRTMTDTMRVVDGHLVDRIGTRGQLEARLDIRVVGGALHMTSRRLGLRVFGLLVPLPPVARIRLREEAGDDGAQHVDVRISAPLIGEVYGYSGTFAYAVCDTALFEDPPAGGCPTVPETEVS